MQPTRQVSSEKEKMKAAHEHEVLEAFCETYTRTTGCRCALPTLLSPQVSHGGLRPDAIIEVDRNNVFIELAQYRDIGCHNSLVNYDMALKESIWRNTLGSLPPSSCMVSIEYRMRSSEADDYAVPGSNGNGKKSELEREQFTQELLRFIEDHAAHLPTSENGCMFAFRTVSGRLCQQSKCNADVLVHSTSYPILARFCRHLTLHSASVPVFPQTSMNSRWASINTDSIRDCITKKLQKSQQYRQSVQKAPLWLVYYSGPFPLTMHPTGLHPSDSVLQVMREVVQQSSGNEFDSIWWMELHRQPYELHPVWQREPRTPPALNPGFS